jgi:hypothetical protein
MEIKCRNFYPMEYLNISLFEHCRLQCCVLRCVRDRQDPLLRNKALVSFYTLKHNCPVARQY